MTHSSHNISPEKFGWNNIRKLYRMNQKLDSSHTNMKIFQSHQIKFNDFLLLKYVLQNTEWSMMQFINLYLQYDAIYCALFA